MGEAKRRRAMREGVPQIPPDSRAVIATAIHKAVSAVTAYYGADCVLYAQVGAEVLRRSGLDAIAVVGTASWRVGPGDGDIVSHLTGLLAPGAKAGTPLGFDDVQSGVFHAWVQAGDDVIDFSTATLRHKAKLLDDMDGGKTQVDWAPDFVWMPRDRVMTHLAVAQSPRGGAAAYVRDARMEGVVFEGIDPEDVAYLADVAGKIIQSIAAGQDLRVIGVSGGGELQDVAIAKFMSRTKGLSTIEPSDIVDLSGGGRPRERF